MSTDPWIGDRAADSPGTCCFAVAPGQPRCDQAATIHILSESAIHRLVALATCDRHAPIGRAAGATIAEHSFGPGCAASRPSWRDDHCEPAPEGKPDQMPAESLDMDAWIEGREAWLSEGIAKGYAASEVRCATHDGEPTTPAEELAFEDGYDDPCIPIIRIANDPGERFIPRFGR